MPRELFEKLKEYLEKKRIEVVLYNANVEAARMLESSSKVQEYLRLCGVKSIVPELKELDKYNAFREFIKENNITDTNGLFVYDCTCMEYSYYDPVTSKVEKAYELLTRDDLSASCRKYLDIERNSSIIVPIEECEEFEVNHKIIEVSLDIARREFLDMSLQSGQEEAAKELYKRYRLK